MNPEYATPINNIKYSEISQGQSPFNQSEKHLM